MQSSKINRSAPHQARPFIGYPGDQAVMSELIATSTAKPLFGYIGSKRRLVSRIVPCFPRVESMVAPFIGGGSVELAMAAQGVRCHAGDLFGTLARLWQILLSRPHVIAEVIEQNIGCDLQTATRLLAKPDNQTEEQEAVILFLMFRTVFYGKIRRQPDPASFSRTYTRKFAAEIRGFSSPNLSVEHCDYRELLARHPDKFAYCDPPYLLPKSTNGNIYKKHSMDHEELASVLETRRAPWALSMNDCEWARDRFRACRIKEFPVKYGITDFNVSPEHRVAPSLKTELLILGGSGA